MNSICIDEIKKATDASILINNIDIKITNVVIDSRQANNHSVFIAIVGANLNGHDFATSAYNNGCRVFIKEKGYSLKGIEDADDITVLEVINTENALGDIAKYYKNNFKIPFVGITGSVGKTTTRDMVYSVLNSKLNTLKNEKNFNNQIGVPLTLFNLNNEHETCIIEMGMRGFKEIEYLADIVEPNIAIITNIGQSHIERLGSRLGIFKAKMEITKNFNPNSTLIVNGDDSCLKTLSEYTTQYKIKTFGFNPNCTIYCKSFTINSGNTDFTCIIENKEYTFTIPTIGEHNIYNAMSAILTGLTLNIPLDNIKQGLKELKITGMRLEVDTTDNFTIINDTYNASPDSMLAALNVLSTYKTRKVAVLGDMFELGDFTIEGHQTVGKNLLNKADALITIGENSKHIYNSAIQAGFVSENAHHFNTKDECDLLKLLNKNDTILFKASRGMALESLIDRIK